MTAGRSDLVDVTGCIAGETDLAIRFHDGARTVWLPRSQIEIDAGSNPRIVTVTMPEWLAKEKELI